ncbi:MAG: bifunctional nuclease family protein [Bryobacteraceae bacterium]|nr:bifunctional nuclease family protein [Bryobacteraceae bacterium]
MEVEMKIRTLMMDPVTQMPIVILRDLAGDTILPIWVGPFEANAIALEIEKVSTARPMTHDLIKTLLAGLDTSIEKVVVNELKDETFYALIWLRKNGQLISVDSRPSDALALALRHDCPIFVDDQVLATSKLTAQMGDRVNNEELKRWLEALDDEHFGRYKM